MPDMLGSSSRSAQNNLHRQYVRSGEFTSKERDSETGLDYFGARYLSGAQGRFTTVDPTMESVVLANPQTWNRYSYVLNNPLRFVDPDGELRVASGSSSDPYSWVDSCEKSQTCYTSVAANIGRDVCVYGSTNAQDISNFAANRSGMTDLNAVAGQHPRLADKGFAQRED